MFHRVINEFMIQEETLPVNMPTVRRCLVQVKHLATVYLRNSTRPIFTRKAYLPQRGIITLKRQSSNCQFYIVQGRKSSDEELNSIECNVRQGGDLLFRYTEAQRKIYKTVGGTPFLDQNYTVFGEVVKGLDVIDKIAKAPTNSGDRPVKNIRMKMKMLN